MFIGKIVIAPVEGKPMELRMKGLYRLEVVSLESKVKIAAGGLRTRKDVRIALEFSPDVFSEWQAPIMAAALAFDLTWRARSVLFSSSAFSRFLTRQFLRD